jgi:competence protein ComEA
MEGDFMWITKAAGACLLALASHAWAAVDINTASSADLDSIKGIGPSTLAKIVAERKTATFKDWSDVIARISGIGPKRAEQMSNNGLTVNGAKFRAPSSPTISYSPSSIQRKP